MTKIIQPFYVPDSEIEITRITAIVRDEFGTTVTINTQDNPLSGSEPNIGFVDVHDPLGYIEINAEVEENLQITFTIDYIKDGIPCGKVWTVNRNAHCPESILFDGQYFVILPNGEHLMFLVNNVEECFVGN